MKIRPIKKWVVVETDGIGKQKKTDQGIVYTEKITSKLVWSRAIAVGDGLTEDIKVGDMILWDITKGVGNAYGGNDIVHQDWIAAIDRGDE